MNRKYALGIDLGTTNNVLAYTQLEAERVEVKVLAVPQLVAPATVESRESLPSFLYLPTDEEKATDSHRLPWAGKQDTVVGELARKQSADVPTRTVAAAKSWLCHSRVDRHDTILPWNAPDDVGRISPVEASRRYLLHLASAWNHAFPDAPIHEQHVVLTVPASFDASARELTHEAALGAGLPDDLVLLEEPQAAVYAWLAQQGDAWRERLAEGDRLLVCDVGGGTTDFTLVGVESEDGALALKRIAVGDHILVGGDNMDLTLAHLAQSAFAEQGVQVDAWQAVALWHACRTAKETLLSVEAPETHAVSVLGRGSRLIGGTITTELDRDEAATMLLDGFFPFCAIEDTPARRRASGFRELGLPFEADTGITRHLARFLATHGASGQPVRPTHLLFNGGVLKASALQNRLVHVIGSWFGLEGRPQILEGNADLDFAVARGAAYYAFAKQRDGIRIRSGTGRSYYVGIETAGLAVPGAQRPLHALCVVPFGMEEGTQVDVPGEEIGLVVGEPAHFRFFSSTHRKEDIEGQVLGSVNGELVETDALEAALPAVEGLNEDFVPVRFQSRITELGMFELWCVSSISDDRWKLEFSVRDEGL